jgi:hypothetical protein
MIKKFLFFLIPAFPIFSGLSVYNDSSFTLRVRVITANGIQFGERQVPPHIQMYIEDEMGTSDPVGEGPSTFRNYDSSVTPYQVYWYCLDGTLYSSCMDAASGATVTANTCQGPNYCPCH